VDFRVNKLNEKKPVPKGYILCDFIHVSFLKLQNDSDTEQISSFQKIWYKRRREMTMAVKTYQQGFL
jgi:hypothetical protein